MEYEISSIKPYPDFNGVPELIEPTYQEFFNNFMIPNRPCLIKPIGTNWESTKNWINERSGEPNLDYLNSHYGHTKVIIYNCCERHYNSQKCEQSTFRTYLNRPPSSNLYYLKDWHLMLQTIDNFYQVPLYFASDWLNEYMIECHNDDYRFVYLGKTHTWTPLHADVFGSFSWSVNVCGQKKWIFFPPSSENLLKDNFNNLQYDVNDLDVEISRFEVIQNAGQAMFVPSNWYHQVWNLKDTISINHNWINGCNIGIVWENMEKCLKSIEKEIEDCRDMENYSEHCQVMLKSEFGMDFVEFIKFLTFIANKRLEMLKTTSKRVQFHGHKLGFNHIIFDLNRLQNVIHSCLSTKDDENLYSLLKTIDEILKVNKIITK